MDTYERACCVRGYHVYRHIWSAAVGEVLFCEREPTNSRDRYAVAVKKDEVAIGHLPRKVSRICSLFLRRGGTIHCRVSGGRRYSRYSSEGIQAIYLRAILLVRPALLVTGRRFRHFAIRHRYSPRRNGMRERSLGVRKPISLLEVPKKSHTHC